MNYLQLVQRLAMETGMGTLGIQTAENQTGKALFLATLINEAWSDIQQKRTWNFMRKSAVIPVVAGARAYALADVAPDIREWCKSLDGLQYLRIDNADSSYGRGFYLERHAFIDRFERQPFQSAAPTHFNMEEGYTLGLNTIPVANATLRGYYWKTASSLRLNADEPSMSEDWHMAIVWAALKSYGEYNDAPEMMARGRARYNMLYNNMCNAELPDVTFAASPMGWGDTWR
jgi:hypothetical protein